MILVKQKGGKKITMVSLEWETGDFSRNALTLLVRVLPARAVEGESERDAAMEAMAAEKELKQQ